MTRTILSIFAAAVLLSLAAAGNAIGKTGSSFPLSIEPLHCERIGPITAILEPPSADRSVKTAQIVFDHSGLIISPVAGKNSKKGLTATPQSGRAAAGERGGRPVNPSTQVNISSGIKKGNQSGGAYRTLRHRARPTRRGPGELVVPSLVK